MDLVANAYMLERSERPLHYKRRVSRYRNRANFYIRWHGPVVVTGVPKKFMKDTAQARVLRTLQLAKAADEVVLAEDLVTVSNRKVEAHGTALRDEKL
ncbi:hypothetical protein MMC06_001940 [Schaereria dolodes]|nr:hypothetical protein [Schaereria dolodes]